MPNTQCVFQEENYLIYCHLFLGITFVMMCFETVGSKEKTWVRARVYLK